MNKRKQIISLVSSLLLATFVSVNSAIAERYWVDNLTSEDKQWAEELGNNSKAFGLNSIREKWNELKQMREGFSSVDAGDEGGVEQTNSPNGAVLKVFVSSSMGRNLLKLYTREAVKYDAILVFNGLPDNSWLKLGYLVQDIAEGEDVAIQIDDEAFKEYGVVSVPSFVLVRELDEFAMFDEEQRTPEYDKVSGNIGIRGALRLFVDEGDLHDVASDLLEERGA